MRDGARRAIMETGVGLVNAHTLIQADQVSEHDRILVPTSGHSGGAPDCAVEVLEVTRGERPVLWILLPDGRTSVYVPGRLVHRITAAAK
jgi:hypothetical protein